MVVHFPLSSLPSIWCKDGMSEIVIYKSQQKRKSNERPILLLWAVLTLCFVIGQISDNVLKLVSMQVENGK